MRIISVVLLFAMFIAERADAISNENKERLAEMFFADLDPDRRYREQLWRRYEGDSRTQAGTRGNHGGSVGGESAFLGCYC